MTDLKITLQPTPQEEESKTSMPTANGDTSDGYQWKMIVTPNSRKHPYTIFQTIDRTTHYKSGAKSETDTVTFTEMWHKPAAGFEVDSFRVPRWWRSPDEENPQPVAGHLEVKAKLWVVKGNVPFKNHGAVKSKEGKEPWGDTHGLHKVLTPPGNYIDRHFKVTWDNPKEFMKEKLEKGADLNVVINKANHVVNKQPKQKSPPPKQKQKSPPPKQKTPPPPKQKKKKSPSLSPELYMPGAEPNKKRKNKSRTPPPPPPQGNYFLLRK